MTVNPDIQQRIVAAANALVGEGINAPTNDQVRERLGGGSLSHISPAMRQWRQDRQAAVVTALTIPAELKQAIETSLSQVWEAAGRLATGRIERIQQEATDQQRAAEVERDEALGEVTRLEERISELQDQRAEQEDRCQCLQIELEKLRVECSRLTADSGALLIRLDERDQQITELKVELKAARQDNKALQAQLVTIAKETHNGARIIPTPK